MRLSFILGFLVLSFSAHAQQISGQATVIDGDTLEIGGTRIRLHGIDAPESRQTCRDETGREYRCGQRAAFALADWIGKATVSCRPTDTDRYGRVVAVCSARGTDMNQWMVRQGWAVAYRQYSSSYVPDELLARSARSGIWAGSFVPPSEWRRNPRGAATEPVGNRFLGVVAGPMSSEIMAYLFAGYLTVISLGTFLAFAWDKHRARNGLYRMSERTLLTLTAMGGTMGALAGQGLFRHKTKKQPFRTYLYIIIAIQITAMGALSVPFVRETVWQLAQQGMLSGS